MNNAPDAHEKSALADFTTTPRMLPVALMATAIGVVVSYVALLLLKLSTWSTKPAESACCQYICSCLPGRGGAEAWRAEAVSRACVAG